MFFGLFEFVHMRRQIAKGQTGLVNEVEEVAALEHRKVGHDQQACRRLEVDAFRLRFENFDRQLVEMEG